MIQGDAVHMTHAYLAICLNMLFTFGTHEEAFSLKLILLINSYFYTLVIQEMNCALLWLCFSSALLFLLASSSPLYLP